MHCRFVFRLVWMPDEGQCLNWSLQCCCKCKHYQVSPLFKHCFHLIAREAKACQPNQGNIFYVFFISRTSVSQASQSLFCDIHDLNDTLFFREQTTALPSPCEWDWEHSCTSSPKHLTASRQRHPKIIIPHKVPVKLHQLELTISLKWWVLVMC